MLRSWLKTAWRYSRNSKLYTFLNLAGLATGAAVAIIVTLWVRNELTFDMVHGHYDRIAQVMDNQPADGNLTTSELLPIPLAAELRNRYGSDFSRVALYFPNFTHILTVNEIGGGRPPENTGGIRQPANLSSGGKSIASTGSWVQPDLPEMLTLTMLQGSRDALKDPSAVLITHSLAQSLFGASDPMGRIIRVDNSVEVKVGGIFEDLPLNSTFYDAKLFLSWDKAVEEMSWMKDYRSAWDAHGWKIFVQLSEHGDIDRVSRNIGNLMAIHSKDNHGGDNQGKDNQGKDNREKDNREKDASGKAAGETLFLYPMSRWHLYGTFSNGVPAGGRISIVRLFAGIGAFVLLLACINFMNLATARSERRAKEVGVRKVIGSLRHQLIGQFLGEALLMTTLAVILSLVIVQLTLPFFNGLAGKRLTLPWSEPAFAGLILVFILFTALLAGSYPAFYLSRFRPVKVLKGDLRSGPWASLPRKVLVVLQFTVSISLIICTILVDRQVRFAKDRPVGYSRAGLLTIGMNTPELYQARYDALRDDLLQTGVVNDMAQSTTPATEQPEGDRAVEWLGKDPGSKPSFTNVGITPDYGHTIGWQVLAGRDFDRTLVTDSQKVILNESAARLIGLQGSIGKSIRIWGAPHTIIGVVRDMVTASPFQRVQPGFFTLTKANQVNAITIRVRPDMPMHAALAAIEKVFRKYNPFSPFDYRFVDAEYALKFADEERVDGLARVFTILAIGISYLGLFGLAAYSAEQRTREIGIRKVLGSSGFRIWRLLTREAVWLIGLSSMIAVPLSALFMHRWLQQYGYRVPPSPWIFCAACIGAGFIALCTVSYQGIKAARRNPVKSLRSE